MILVGVRPLQKEKKVLQSSHFLPDRIVAGKLLGIFHCLAFCRDIHRSGKYRAMFCLAWFLLKDELFMLFVLLFQRRKSVSPEKNLHLK